MPEVLDGGLPLDDGAPVTCGRLRAELERALRGYATKEDLKAFATKEDLKAFATKEDLKAFATKEDLRRVEVRLEDLRAFATKEDLRRVEVRLEDLQGTVHLILEMLSTALKTKERVDGQEARLSGLRTDVDATMAAVRDHEDRLRVLERVGPEQAGGLNAGRR